MRLTTKGRYAVTAMLDLAMHESAGPVSLSDIAERQDISLSYLEQLFGKLKRAGLLASVRGPGGGYKLARDSAAVSVSDIITAVGEGIDATRCGGAGDCRDGHICLTHNLWADLSERIDGFLREIDLAGLVQSEQQRSSGDAAGALLERIDARIL
ncbi:MAG: Rrf2 family transcriptional regulator [Pseudomonadaceae bacterium]|nr:Rrf2 family transcriptional regulator [Pseudomonadaceae bacterium]